MTDWRARWGYDFPFAWAQLPNFSGRTEAWCLVREGQRAIDFHDPELAAILEHHRDEEKEHAADIRKFL